MSRTVTLYPSVQQRLLIDCTIGVPDTLNPIRDAQTVICHGLIDTGAMVSAISKRVSDFMELAVTGGMELLTANGHADVVDTHIVNVGLGGDVRFPMMQVPCIEMDDEDLIIGMDILSQGDLAITNSGGKTVFMFKLDGE